MEFNQILIRLLQEGSERAEEEVLHGRRHVTEEHTNGEVLSGGVTDVHKVSLQTIHNRLRHALRGRQRGLHSGEVRNLRHGGANGSRRHNADIHVVVTHDEAQRLAIRHQRHLRGTVDGIHRLTAEASARREQSNLTAAALLHSRQKGKDRVERSVDIDGIQLTSHHRIVLRGTTLGNHHARCRKHQVDGSLFVLLNQELFHLLLVTEVTNKRDHCGSFFSTHFRNLLKAFDITAN